jgi:hypothetical protein
VNQGCGLQAGASRASLDRALDSFDQAIEHLSRLPFASSPRFRHNLAAAWMNRADTLTQIGTEVSLAGALPSYDRALALARELPLDDKPSFRILLASCWINRGSLCQHQSIFPEAVQDNDRAVAALGPLPQSGHRLACHHAATAWTNRGEALLQPSPFRDPAEAVRSARTALALVEGRVLGGGADAKLELRALRVVALGLDSTARSDAAREAAHVDELIDLAEHGMKIACSWRPTAPDLFEPFLVWFFTLGAQAYGRHRPQFLAEFAEEAFQRWKFRRSSAVGTKLRAVAQQEIASALDGLCANRLMIDGSPKTELLIQTVRGLREASARLQS